MKTLLIASLSLGALLALGGTAQAAENSWIQKSSRTLWGVPTKAGRADIPYYYQANTQSGTPVYIGPAKSEGYPPPPTGYISPRLFNH